MALVTFKCNNLTSLHFKGLTKIMKGLFKMEQLFLLLARICCIRQPVLRSLFLFFSEHTRNLCRLCKNEAADLSLLSRPSFICDFKSRSRRLCATMAPDFPGHVGAVALLAYHRRLNRRSADRRCAVRIKLTDCSARGIFVKLKRFRHLVCQCRRTT